MALDLKKSQLSQNHVSKVIERGYETLKAMNGGRNPSEKQRENMKNLVIQQAKRVDRDRGIK